MTEGKKDPTTVLSLSSSGQKVNNKMKIIESVPWTINEVKIDINKVIQCSLVDINDVFIWFGRYRCDSDVENSSSKLNLYKSMPMPGFEETFRDIVDYILRITFWIWHDKHVELCKDYYSDTCIMHTMVGDLQGGVGACNIITNTWATLASFSDRTLDGQNVVWSVESWKNNMLESTVFNNSSLILNDNSSSLAYYSSHLIYSRMTHDGTSIDFGSPTNITAQKVKTIADCVCFRNMIVEEWLMRDNAYLAIALGLDYKLLAKQQAQRDLLEGRNVLELLAKERERVQANCITLVADEARNTSSDAKPAEPPSSNVDQKDMVSLSNFDPTLFAKQVFDALWQRQAHNEMNNFYDYRIEAHLTAGRDLYGIKDFISLYLLEIQTGLSKISVSIDHIACIPYISTTSGIVDVAVRWTLVALHSGDSTVLGAKSDTPVYILASSHWRLYLKGTCPRIREEWTVFDEMALCRQVETKRLLENPQLL